MVPKTASNCKDFAVAGFIRFLRHLKLKEYLSKLSDKRQASKTKYSNYSLVLWALSVFFFRQKSKNALHTAIKNMRSQQQRGLLEYLEIEKDSFPDRTVVDDYLRTLDPEEINNLLIQLFNWGQKSKLFYNHAETLLPNNHFLLGSDGFWVHTYDKPHAVDEHGNNSCPYCLARTYNKGEPNEYTQWVHVFVTFSFLFPTGLRLPIYVYPLKASQIQATDSTEKLKQECELTAFHLIIPKLRQRLGRIQITLLLDSLYANEPAMDKAKLFNMGYLTVRQEGSLKSVKQLCDELAQTEIYQKFYQSRKTINCKNGKHIEQTAQWFNKVAFGKDAQTNVLRFREVTKDKKGEVIHVYTNEWLCADGIYEGNCFDLAKRARMRFSYHEDMHNTLKNRDFAAEHDYARADPNCLTIWKLLMFVAFAIDQLFNFTLFGKKLRGTLSYKKFAQSLFEELIKVPWCLIIESPILHKSKVQFRFAFGVPSG